MKEPDGLKEVTWPQERFFWAVVDASLLPKRRRNHEQLCYLLEPHLPLPVEAVHATFLPLENGQFLACAVEEEKLEKLDDSAISLLPGSIPDWVPTLDSPPRINLLMGKWQPAPVTRAIRRLHRIMALVVAVMAVTAVIGVERRIRRTKESTTAIQNEAQAMMEQILGSSPSLLSPELRLETELRKLRRTREVKSKETRERNAAETLSEFFATWPPLDGVRTESVIVNQDTVHLRQQAKDGQVAEQFLDALEGPEGWVRHLPRIQSDQDSVSLSLEWSANEGKRP